MPPNGTCIKGFNSWKIVLFFSSFFLNAISGYCQEVVHFTFNQPPVLEVKTGSDTIVNLGASIELGENLEVTGGDGNYSYIWGPASNIFDPYQMNPLISPNITTIYYVTVSDGNGCSARDSILVQVVPLNENFTLIIQEPLINFQPNPIKDVLQLNITDAQGDEKYLISISTLNGEIVMQDIVSRQSGNEIVVSYNIGHLSSGYYLLNVNSNNNSKTFKIIKN